MKSVLITGSGGFLGKVFKEYFTRAGYTVIPTKRDVLDVTDSHDVDRIFRKHKVDIVLHTAVRGGSRLREDTFGDYVDNISMFRNLVRNRDNYEMLFCFCSGAAFDRRRNLDRETEEAVAVRRPEDYYGAAKNMIARQILKSDDGIFNFRLFGCFGGSEDSTRFISSAISSMMSANPVKIHQDKEMDFFYVEDLCKVIRHYIENYDGSNNFPHDLNMSYKNKLSLLALSGMLRVICRQPDAVVDVEHEGPGKSYTGDGRKLESLNLKLKGLPKGIIESYDVEYYTDL